MTNYLLIAVFSIFSFTLIAQSDENEDFDLSELYNDDSKKEKNGYSAIIFNVHIDALADLRKALIENEYPMLDEYGYEFGFMTVSNSSKKFAGVFKAEWYNRKTVTSNALNNSAKVNGYGIGLGTELRLIDTKSFFIKPMVAVNFKQYKIFFSENIKNEATLGDVLNSDYKEYNIRSFQFPLEAAVSIGVRFGKKDPNVLFVRAGYNFNWNNDNWKLGQDAQLSNEIDLSSPYVSIGLGKSM